MHTRQRYAAALPRRQSAHRHAALLDQADAHQSGLNFIARNAAAQPDAVAQILERSQIALEAVVVAEIGELAVVAIRIGGDINAAPADTALFEWHQSAQRPQQCGLAGTVGAGDLQAFTGLYAEA